MSSDIKIILKPTHATSKAVRGHRVQTGALPTANTGGENAGEGRGGAGKKVEGCQTRSQVRKRRGVGVRRDAQKRAQVSTWKCGN